MEARALKPKITPTANPWPPLNLLMFPTKTLLASRTTFAYLKPQPSQFEFLHHSRDSNNGSVIHSPRLLPEIPASMVQTRQRALNGANGHVNGHALEKSSTGFAKGPDGDEKTDYSRWRLLDEHGRHTWHYLTTDEEIKAWPQTVADKFHLGLPTVSLSLDGIYDLVSNRYRIFQSCPRQHDLPNRSKTASPSIRTCNSRQATGPANMVDLSSSYPAL
jgi:hypothetical protein